MVRTNLLFAASAASMACLAIFALTGCNPAQPVTNVAAAEPTKPVGQQHSTPTEPGIWGTWYKVGDDRETFIAIEGDWFSRADAKVAPL